MRKLLLLVVLCILAACATSPTGRKQLMLISPEQAISASREAYVQTMLPLEKKGKVDSNPVVSKRVKNITGKIITQTIQQFPHTKDWQWSIKVIDDPKTVNAWCMAGGKMAIYTGLLEKVKPTDDELAQVLGHEISHAVANHSAERMSVALASQLGLMAVAVAAKDSDYVKPALTGTALAAAVAIQLPNSRTSEAEADEIGMKLAALAGYDPRAAATLWKKMGEVGGSSPPEFLSTHPNPANRQETLRRMAPSMMPYYKEVKKRPIYRLD